MFGRREAWRDLEPTERAAIVLGGVVQIALQGRRVARSSPPGGRGAQRLKRVWALVSFVNFLGPIAHFLAGRRRTIGACVGSSR